jgi:parvulin-like peptidyl-prolyl isomerase
MIISPKRRPVIHCLGLIFLAAALAIVFSVPSAGAADEPLKEDREDRVVARVGEEAINLKDLEEYLSLRPPGNPRDPKSIQRRLEEMITAEILYQEALDRGVDKIPEIRMSLQQILGQKLMEISVEKAAIKGKISDDELRRYYEDHLNKYSRPEQVRLADIFFGAPENDVALRGEKRSLAEEVLEEVKNLQDKRFGFGELVLAHSDTHLNYPRGDTGFFDREGDPLGLDPALAEAAFEIESNGEVLGRLVETPEGFHIIMRVGRRGARHKDLEEVRHEITNKLHREKRRKARRDYLDGLRKKASVSIDEAFLAEILKDYQEKAGEAVPEGTAPPAIPAE